MPTFVGSLMLIILEDTSKIYNSMIVKKGLVTQRLEYAPDKRGVSSSNLLEPINLIFLLTKVRICFTFSNLIKGA
jgi:hypothetical protein